MTTYPLATLAPTISATGITAPSYEDILASIEAQVKSIYGTDIVLDASSQDGQFLAVFASALNDSNNAVLAAYLSYAPTTAQGVGLSNAVKINGLQRNIATNSQAVVTLGGVAGTIITNGIVGDNQNLNTKWALPASVTIPPGGTIDVTATCTEEGSTIAGAGTLTQILTPTRNWQSVTNAAAATPGSPVEDDATLRQRQAASTALPAQSPFDAILAALANIPGVSRYYGYENATSSTDANGIPAHSISMIVEGGDLDVIAQTIADKKTPGTGTYGSTTRTTYDEYGIPLDINFYVLALTEIYIEVTITALPGYLSTTGDAIKAALVEYISTLEVGETVYYTRLFAPATLNGSAAQDATGLTQAQLNALSNTFDITALTVDTVDPPVGTSDIPIDFNKAASLLLANITVTVSP